jgi:hypothetical protein
MYGYFTTAGNPQGGTESTTTPPTTPPPTTNTTPPVITEVHTENIVGTGAHIKWHTDVSADSRVILGVSTAAMTMGFNTRCDGDGYVTDHCVIIAGLPFSTTHYFKVLSRTTTSPESFAYGYFATAQNPQGSTVPPPITPPTNTVPPPTTSTTTASIQPNDSAPRILIPEIPYVPPTKTTPPPPLHKEPLPTATKPTEQPIHTDLTDVKASLDQFRREATTLETAVRTTVSRDAEKVYDEASQVSGRAFSPEEREWRLAELTRKIDEHSEELSASVRETVMWGTDEARGNLGPVLKSSLGEVELLIEAETNVDVDLSPSARTITTEIKERTPQVIAAQQEFLTRDGLDLYEDTDNDGVSNFDERRVYNTNPENAYTAGSVLTDGERILLGFDVHSTTTERVPVESPYAAGEVAHGLFEVQTIEVVKQPEKPATATESGQPAEEKVFFSGRALPNSFVTLYIFSTPIVVTVKANETGEWTYALDTELEDGGHELYVATVDTGGRILAKSPAVPFIKTAEAVEFTPLLVPATPDADPLDILRNNLIFIVAAGLVVFSLLALLILGAWRATANEGTPPMA